MEWHLMGIKTRPRLLGSWHLRNCFHFRDLWEVQRNDASRGSKRDLALLGCCGFRAIVATIVSSWEVQQSDAARGSKCLISSYPGAAKRVVASVMVSSWESLEFSE